MKPTADQIDPMIVRGQSFAEYTAADGLNCSTLKRFVPSALAGAHAMQADDLPGRELLLGRALHDRFEGEATYLARMHPVKGLKPNAQAQTFAKAQAARPGATILAEGWAGLVERMYSAVMRHPDAGALMRFPAEREVSLFWTDPDLGVRCKARLDRMTRFGGIDLKTTSQIGVQEIEKSVARFGYHLQCAWYMRAMRFACGMYRPDFGFVFVESSAPHDVVVTDLDPEAIEQGWAEACIAAGRYIAWKKTRAAPGVAASRITVGLPRWAQAEGMKAPYALLEGTTA